MHEPLPVRSQKDSFMDTPPSDALSLSARVRGETLRLALCGPDYNGISAAAYYTGL